MSAIIDWLTRNIWWRIDRKPRGFWRAGIPDACYSDIQGTIKCREGDPVAVCKMVWVSYAPWLRSPSTKEGPTSFGDLLQPDPECRPTLRNDTIEF